MKTFNNWIDTSYEQYAQAGDEIDAETHDYFLGVLPPMYYSNGVFQVSEPYSHNTDNTANYSTFQYNIKLDKYFYLGIISKAQAKEMK